MRARLRAFTPIKFCFLLIAGLSLAACDESSNLNIEDLMKQATEARVIGDLRTSSIVLKGILKQNPKHTGARLMLGQIYIDIGDAESAEKELEVARELGAKASNIDILTGHARLLRGDYEGVLKDYQVEDSHSAMRRSRYHLLRGLAFLARGQLNAAEESFQHAVADYKKDINEERPHLKLTEPAEFVKAIAGLTKVAVNREKWDEAQTHLDRAKAISPNDHDVLDAEGELAFKQEKFKESETAFQAAFDRRPYDMKMRIGIARAQLLQDKYDEAITHFNVVLKHFPNHVVTNYYRSLAALRSEDYENAKKFSGIILKNRPNYILAHLVSGVANYGLNSYEQANLHLSRYLNATPDNKDARRLHGLTLMRLSNPSEALATFKPLYEQHPQDKEVLSLIAEAASKSGDLVLAKSYLTKAIELDPNNKDVKIRLALAKVSAGDEDEALRDLEAAVEKLPEFLRAQYALLSLHLRSREFDKALNVVGDLKTVDSENNNPWIGEGLAYMGKRDWPKALTAFETALKMSPGHIGASYGIANVYQAMGEIEKVRTVYSQILEKHPGNLATLLRLASFEVKQGKIEKSKALIEQASKANPDALVPKTLLAQVAIENNQPLKAIQMLKELSDNKSDQPIVLEVLGRAQIAAKKPGEAALSLERLVRLKPNDAAARFLLAQAYSLLGNRIRMHAELEKAIELQPRSLRASVASIRALVIDGQRDQAGRRLVKLKKDFPGNLDVLKLDAWISLRENRHDDAAKILEKVRSQESSEELTIQYASALWGKKEHENAIKILEDWNTKNAASPSIQMELANLYILLGRNNKARQFLMALVENQPINWIALNNLANLLMDENLEKAQEYAERALSASSNSTPAIVTMVEILLKSKTEPQRSLKLIRPVAKNFMENNDVQVLYAQALSQNNKRAAAVEKLKEIMKRELPAYLRTKSETLIRELEN